MNRSFLDEPVPSAPFAAWELGAGSLGKPAGKFRFLWPRISSRPRGGLLAVWGEPAADDSASSQRAKVRQLWSASYDLRHGWSAPRQIASGADIFWREMSGAASFVDPDGAFHLFVPAVPDEGNVQVLHLRNIRDTWSRTFMDLDLLPLYVSVAAAPDGQVSMAIVAAGNAGVYSSAMYLMESHDAGRSWSPARLVARADLGPASDILAFAPDPATRHLLWSESLSGSPLPDLIRLYVSSDSGHTVIQQPSLRPPGPFDALRAVVDACNTLHVVYEHRAGEPGAGSDVHLDYVTWNGVWGTPQHLFPALTSLNPALSYDADRGRLRLVWIGRPVEGETRAPLTTYFAERGPGGG